jgi:hypothetical protein
LGDGKRKYDQTGIDIRLEETVEGAIAIHGNEYSAFAQESYVQSFY